MKKIHLLIVFAVVVILILYLTRNKSKPTPKKKPVVDPSEKVHPEIVAFLEDFFGRQSYESSIFQNLFTKTKSTSSFEQDVEELFSQTDMEILKNSDSFKTFVELSGINPNENTDRKNFEEWYKYQCATMELLLLTKENRTKGSVGTFFSTVLDYVYKKVGLILTKDYPKYFGHLFDDKQILDDQPDPHTPIVRAMLISYCTFLIKNTKVFLFKKCNTTTFLRFRGARFVIQDTKLFALASAPTTSFLRKLQHRMLQSFRCSLFL
jgi:hypothetical protein